MSLLADGLGSFTLSEGAFWLLRAVAGVGGAFLGWFLSGPLVRLGYWLAFQKAIPEWLVPWLKLAGAVAVGLLVFWLIPLGGGPGGWGFGMGQGGGPGLGPGKGSDKIGSADGKSSPADKKAEQPADKKGVEEKKTPRAVVERQPVDIELIDRGHYQNDDRYYLLNRKPPPLTLAEVKAHLDKARQDKKLEVHIVLTEQSVDRGHESVVRLGRLIEQYGDVTMSISRDDRAATK